MSDLLLIMQATDCKSKYTCMEVEQMIVGSPPLLVGLEVCEPLQLLAAVPIFGEVEMWYLLSQPM